MVFECLSLRCKRPCPSLGQSSRLDPVCIRPSHRRTPLLLQESFSKDVIQLSANHNSTFLDDITVHGNSTCTRALCALLPTIISDHLSTLPRHTTTNFQRNAPNGGRVMSCGALQHKFLDSAPRANSRVGQKF